MNSLSEVDTAPFLPQALPRDFLHVPMGPGAMAAAANAFIPTVTTAASSGEAASSGKAVGTGEAATGTVTWTAAGTATATSTGHAGVVAQAGAAPANIVPLQFRAPQMDVLVAMGFAQPAVGTTSAHYAPPPPLSTGVQ